MKVDLTVTDVHSRRKGSRTVELFLHDSNPIPHTILYDNLYYRKTSKVSENNIEIAHQYQCKYNEKITAIWINENLTKLWED